MSTSLLFNPSQAPTEELESTFVGRHALLKRIEGDLIRDHEIGTPRHWQIVGPRGSGKSHLTELLARRMRANHNWRIARLPEENYQVATLGELLEQILVRSEYFASGSPLEDTADDVHLQERAIDRLRQLHASSQRPLVVVVENLASLFERQLRATRDQARLRDLLTNNPSFVLVATSTSQSDATLKHSAPLYEFFQTIVLDDLTQMEITELVKARAGWERNASLLADFDRVKGRLDAIYHLSGGNPRLALALYRVVQHGVTTELHDQIMKLLDEVTPYYQARLNDIPPQAARVLTEMAIADHVIAPAVIAKRCRMPTNQVTAQIGKLIEERLVVQGGKPSGRSRLYELKDRLLRIWLQMRESVGAAKRLRFLAEFFERWYANQADELEAFSRRTVSDFWSDLAVGDDRRCVDRLKTLSYLADVHPGFDGSVVLRAMSAQVDESTRADIRAHVESLKKTFDRSTDLREREALAFLLSECFIALSAEGEAARYLKGAIDDGSQSEKIVARYLSSLVDVDAFADAWTFGLTWLNHYPEHTQLLSSLSIAAFGVGQIDKGFDLIERSVGPDVCSHCTEKLLRSVLKVMRSNEVDRDIELRFWKRFVGVQSRVDATPDEVNAALQILSEFQLSKITSDLFTSAAGAWRPLSQAPPWLLSKSICGLAHRSTCEGETLAFISALAEQSHPHPLSAFAVDHLVEILPALRHSRGDSLEAARRYIEAMSLVRRRTRAPSLASAFRRTAPLVANRFRSVARDLLDLYREWLEEGLLEEPITPYSEAVSALSSEDPAKVLQLLHAESRDAVSMLLDAVLAGARPKVKSAELQAGAGDLEWRRRGVRE
jgi:energy-coupling factor transporter ATP-binding protein EcfA2